MNKPEALRLAKELPWVKHTAEWEICDAAAAELRRLSAVEAQRDALLAALKTMNRAYVNLLENGRDRITMLGGQCDPVDVMEVNDPNLRETRAAIAAVEGGGK